MSPSELALAARNAEIERFYCSHHFRKWFFTSIRYESWTPSVQAYAEVVPEVRTAIVCGVMRAWMDRFLATEHPTFRLPRRRNFSEDYEKVLTAFPELDNYLPTSPLTVREVYLATRKEFNHFVATPARAVGRRQLLSLDTVKATPWAYTDCLSTPDAAFGPVVLRVAAQLLVEFGLTATTQWVFARYVFDDEYRTTLRALGATNVEQENPKHFHKLQINLRRKLVRMDDSVRALRVDSELQDLVLQEVA